MKIQKNSAISQQNFSYYPVMEVTSSQFSIEDLS